MRHQRLTGGYGRPFALALIAIAIVVALAGLVCYIHHKAKPAVTVTSSSNACVSRSLTRGSTGHCVSDVQTLVNYMETSGLTECQFNSGAALTVNGTYDGATAKQVTAVQSWAACYASQEGFASNVKQTGSVNKATWGELCTYGYTDPLRSHSAAAGTSGALAAGKDAGCAQLQS